MYKKKGSFSDVQVPCSGAAAFYRPNFNRNNTGPHENRRR